MNHEVVVVTEVSPVTSAAVELRESLLVNHLALSHTYQSHVLSVLFTRRNLGAEVNPQSTVTFEADQV